ncbi:phosphatase PAP2 family protein [Phytohabitans aurantiacus]|uniref:Inositol phosphorylceramide synthase n=1 Tax=Phytohabitans aurantiacus TaxID=3016789 RepID=A0ABQ5QWB8_9ACTN|nr:phosphatase PAP2 family protein [Phytohabitans aurantiacus]GLH98845.1 inositol phosphorylceramide synthase [Phytohabitans aurantiacus]
MSSGHRAARPKPVRELLLVAVLFLAYRLGRQALAGDLPTAYANAAGIWHLERAWGLPNEAALQQTILGHGWLVRAANLYYAGVHFPATAAFLLWTYLRRPHLYRWARTTLAALTAAAFTVQVLIPLAPPRLLAAAGMVDTAAVVGPNVYTASTDAITNQYAAMPSLHVGWAAVVAIVLIHATGGRWRWLWLLHPLATLAVVVATANHYWLDAAVALTLLGAILLLLSRHRDSPQWIGVPIGRHAAAWFVGTRRVRLRERRTGTTTDIAVAPKI